MNSAKSRRNHEETKSAPVHDEEIRSHNSLVEARSDLAARWKIRRQRRLVSWWRRLFTRSHEFGQMSLESRRNQSCSSPRGRNLVAQQPR
ncbi:hypothetical protein TIFTF001_002915 [Ficus carica]|uniref:Uncharacterized protein n=1 Tax=Ficus carica TaxID=3494 RepID=A0AA88CUV9_FICCA|nr:hypothetical protein TIFTF001_002915 [Ficus carica]